jgi:hypothetical protein|tara:strand:- start:2838 stop:3059 length:222 start_codon:yes stop_codon:yes gene_type:complete
MSGSPQRRGKQQAKLAMKKHSTKMDMFIPDNLMYEMKPIDRIETKFSVFRKQNTTRTNRTTNSKKRDQLHVNE